MEKDQKTFFPNFDSTLFLRSCEKEAIDPIEGKITGTIPLWLNGALLRNGPGLLKIGDCEFKHIFDSMALLQRFEIKNGKVTYQCRFLQSDVYKANTKANRIVITDFGTSSVPDPCKSLFRRFFSFFEKREIADNANISLYPFGDEIYSFCETPFMHKVDKNTLETCKKFDLTKMGIVIHTSHPHVDVDGSVYNLALLRKGPEHGIVCFPNKPKKHENDYSMYDQAKIVAKIPVRWNWFPSYMHSFGITTNYFVIIEQPVNLSIPKLTLCTLVNSPALNCFQFYPNELTQISVVSRSTGTLSYKFFADTFFYFHIINQYEYEDCIILDVCAYDDALIISSLGVDALRDVHNDPKYANIFKSKAIRLVLPLLQSLDNVNLNENLVKINNTNAQAFLQKDGTILVKWEVLTDHLCEMPTINYEKYRGAKYRYFYGISADITNDYPGCIIKVDTDTKTTTRWFEDNCYANEPIFVPNPDAQDEDDGLIVTSIIWGFEDTHRTGLVVLDAKTMKEIGRAEFTTPGAMPKGFHGWYCPNK